MEGQTDRGTVKSAWIAFAGTLLVAIISGVFNLVQNANNRELKIELISQSAIVAANQNDDAADYSRGVAQGEANIKATLAQRLSEEYGRGYSEGKKNSESSGSSKTSQQNPDFSIASTPLYKFTNIAKPSGESSGLLVYSADELVDNFGKSYMGGYTIGSFEGRSYQLLLDGSYKRFSAVYFVQKGTTEVGNAKLYITVDGIEIYTASLNKTSEPIFVDIEIPPDSKNFVLSVPGYGAISFSGWPPATGIHNAEFHR